MKKILLTASLATAIAASASAEVKVANQPVVTEIAPDVKVTVTPVGERPETSVQPDRKFSTAEVLVNEDFSSFTWGTEAAPDYENPLASVYTGNLDIDPALTNGQQWTGNGVYSAGGAVALSTKNPYQAAYMCTPEMDYSGSVKMTFNVKYEYVEFDNGEGEMMHWTGSTCSVYISNPTKDPFNLGDDDSLLANMRLYQNQGWYEVTIEFDNYSAYNDAFIQIRTEQAILVDNVRITSSVDNFIAPPTDLEIFDVTETSFSVRFDPVHKSFNYYTYLYTLEGYDEDGEPIYYPVCPPDLKADLEAYGMTWEEYVEESFGDDRFNPYLNYGRVYEFKPTVFTYEDLDPAVDYYYGIRSHYVSIFSDLEILPANVIAAPEVYEATDISVDGFTANWSPIVKADGYDVTLFGASRAEADEDSFIVFDEDFSNLSAYSDSDNIYDPTVIDLEESGITINDLTTVPGWITDAYMIKITENALGLYGIQIGTPSIYIANNDYVTLRIKATAAEDEGSFRINFAGKTYRIDYSESEFETDFMIPTNGMEESRLILIGDFNDLFIEHIEVSQSVKKDDYVYCYLAMESVSKDDLSCTFSGLEDYGYDLYAYNVVSTRGEGESMIRSAASERMIVDPSNGGCWTGINAPESVAVEVVETGRYTIDGRKISEPEKGLNIIRYSDGTVRKVFVK